MRISILDEKSGAEFEIEARGEGKTLLTILQENGIYVDAPCSGRGTCGKCRIRLKEKSEEGARAKEMALCAAERERLSGAEQRRGVRLACQVIPERDCCIVIPDSGMADMAVLAGGSAQTGEKDSAVGAAEKGERSGVVARSYGIAIDIGTTTLAASLLDLASGEECAAAAAVNHQRAYGADVISRIQSAGDGKAEQMRMCICSDLKDLMAQLVGQAGISKCLVEKVVISANTTMCHLLRGLSCEGLGIAPYTPVDLGLWEGTCSELLSGDAWDAKVTILPGISAFVGADIVSGIYACGLSEQSDTGFLLDIGTNGEMAVGNRDGFLVTSAAAGPVFEGGNITCGVPGVPGAVTHLTIGGGYETIGGEPPIGLCGTGIIDAVSELVRNGYVDENGTLAEPWFESGVPVAGDTIYFAQQDVREIQMGKSAIRAGIETLLSEYRKRDDCVSEAALSVCLAGGFGYYMDVASAIRIGLFPKEFEGRVRSVGNSSLEGAKRFLREEAHGAKECVEWIVNHAQEIGLAMHPEFNELYLQHMFFE